MVALAIGNDEIAEAMRVSRQTIVNTLSLEIYPRVELEDSALRVRLANMFYAVDSLFDTALKPASYPGTLYVLSGPTGAGKSTLARAVANTMPDLSRIPLVTTRQIKAEEFEGDDYYFLSVDRFHRMHGSGQLLESRIFDGHYYVTPSKPVLEQLKSGRDVLLAGIPWIGIEQILEKVKKVVSIHIQVPRLFIETRLKMRGRENGEELANRIRLAAEHPDEKHLFDHVVVNITFDKAVAEILAQIEARRKLNPLALAASA